MKILIISDIHANPWALRAVEEHAGSVDHVFFAGDAVNYGPAPALAVNWLCEHNFSGVRGNHDHAVTFRTDPKASAAKEALALAMRDWTREQLDPKQIGRLLTLPRQLWKDRGGASFALVHGTPIDPLFDYRLRPYIDDALLDELTFGVHTDVLIVGHTHLPLLRRRGKMQVVNPGSVGQPLDGDPRAAYAIWEDGKIRLCKVAYDHSPLLEALRSLPLESSQIKDLVATIQEARIPATSTN